jgi:Uncharacterized conserved protein
LRISEFQEKDVINIVDGRKLGHVSDLELDLAGGSSGCSAAAEPTSSFRGAASSRSAKTSCSSGWTTPG